MRILKRLDEMQKSQGKNRVVMVLGGKKIKEYINERRDNVSETVFEFDINRFA